MKISFAGLKSVLRKFETSGEYVCEGNWSIAKGGYDLYWEIYYQGVTVLQCVCNELEGGFRSIPEFDDKAEEKLINIVKDIYKEVK